MSETKAEVKAVEKKVKPKIQKPDYPYAYAFDSLWGARDFTLIDTQAKLTALKAPKDALFEIWERDAEKPEEHFAKPTGKFKLYSELESKDATDFIEKFFAANDWGTP